MVAIVWQEYRIFVHFCVQGQIKVMVATAGKRIPQLGVVIPYLRLLLSSASRSSLWKLWKVSSGRKQKGVDPLEFTQRWKQCAVVGVLRFLLAFWFCVWVRFSLCWMGSHWRPGFVCVFGFVRVCLPSCCWMDRFLKVSWELKFSDLAKVFNNPKVLIIRS